MASGTGAGVGGARPSYDFIFARGGNRTNPEAAPDVAGEVWGNFYSNLIRTFERNNIVTVLPGLLKVQKFWKGKKRG